MNVTKIPVSYKHRRAVRGKEIWDQENPPPEMVWEVCPYIRSRLNNCRHCPEYEQDPNYGTVQKGCYGMAAEVCRIVFAMQKRSQA